MLSRTNIISIIAGTALFFGAATPSPADAPIPERYAATFSIVAYDPDTGEWGVAVASRVLAAGYDVSWAKAGVGAIATQAMVNIGYGTDGLVLLEEGLSAEETLEKLLAEDEGREDRQVAIIDADGNVVAFTGTSTLDWSGHKIGEHYSVQGNILVGEEVLTAMAEAYEGTDGPLARRLVNALIAGDEAGGDSRGKQSSGILVVREKGGYQGKFDRMVDIRVDDHEEPVRELARIYDLWEPTYVVARYFDSGGAKEMEYALGIMERIVEEKPDDAEAHNSLAWELASRKLYPERALEIALRANELAPEDANIMDTLAEAHYAAGDYASAIVWEEKALSFDPDNQFFIEQLEKFREAGE